MPPPKKRQRTNSTPEEDNFANEWLNQVISETTVAQTIELEYEDNLNIHSSSTCEPSRLCSNCRRRSSINPEDRQSRTAATNHEHMQTNEHMTINPSKKTKPLRTNVDKIASKVTRKQKETKKKTKWVEEWYQLLRAAALAREAGKDIKIDEFVSFKVPNTEIFKKLPTDIEENEENDSNTEDDKKRKTELFKKGEMIIKALAEGSQVE